MKHLLLGAAILIGMATQVYAQAAQSAPVPVATILAQRKPIAKTLDFVGRVDALNRVEVRARVQGFLEQVLFTEGETVKKGQELYQIEKGLFQAAVEQAEGALERSKAAKVLTVLQLQRAEELLKKSAGTVVARDQALAADQQAKGQIMTDEANLQTARINLGYTDIASAIDGKIGRTKVTMGNVVGPETGPLTVIVSQDPMYVTFPVSQREFLEAQRAGQRTDVQNVQSLKVRLRFADGSTYNHEGRINFIDVTVDRATDTVTVRATFPNPDGVLVEGQLVRVDLESGKPEEQVLVPQAALIADQGGVYVLIVEDGKAVMRRVTPGGEQGSESVITKGLSGGEQVIVEGLQAVRPGTAVRATPASQALSRS
jgi:membrane fusion protein (multidrug efflux system)